MNDASNFDVRLWVVKRAREGGPVDPEAMKTWREMECACGVPIRLGSHGGEHAVAHRAPSCAEFKEKSPVEFGFYLGNFFGDLIRKSGGMQ